MISNSGPAKVPRHATPLISNSDFHAVPPCDLGARRKSCLQRIKMNPSSLLRFSVIACISTLFNGAFASNVVDLTPSNFDEIVGAGKPALVSLAYDLSDF